MTLFIAGLLIYNFNMDWWWYGIAMAIWGYKQYAFDDMIKRNFGIVIERCSCRYTSS